MKPILAIEQDPTLPGLGLLGRVVRARGLPIVSAHAWEGDLDGLRARDFAGIVPLGGSMQAWDEERLPYLGRERELLREAVDEGVPVLGICLGGQLLARALGAEVRPGRAARGGLADGRGDARGRRRPAARAPARARRRVPVAPRRLRPARTAPCAWRAASSSENQAFRYGERAWGLQFHPEVDLPLYLGWIQNYADAPARMGLDPDALEAAVAAGSPEFTEPLFERVLLGLRRRRELTRQLRGSRSGR